MISRLQVMERLKELKHYKFVSYHATIAKGVHRVTLVVEDWRQLKALRHVSEREFIVTEKDGYLSATSVCGRISIDRLS